MSLQHMLPLSQAQASAVPSSRPRTSCQALHQNAVHRSERVANSGEELGTPSTLVRPGPAWFEPATIWARSKVHESKSDEWDGTSACTIWLCPVFWYGWVFGYVQL